MNVLVRERVPLFSLVTHIFGRVAASTDFLFIFLLRCISFGIRRLFREKTPRYLPTKFCKFSIRNKINIAMNGSFVEHRLEAEDYVIVINTHKEEIKRLKVPNTNPQFLLWNQQLLWCVYLSYIQNQMLQHQEYISRLQEELQSAR